MQEIQLDKHVKLLDCPGIVMASGDSNTQIILKNVVKVYVGCCALRKTATIKQKLVHIFFISNLILRVRANIAKHIKIVTEHGTL